MRYFSALLLLAWSCRAHAQASFPAVPAKEYLQTLMEAGTGEPANPLCLACPGEALPAPPQMPIPLRWTEALDLRDSTVCYDYDPYTETWTPASKSVHAYDEAQREVELTYFTWKNGWELSSRITSSYNDAGLLSESIYQQWGMGWVNMYYDLLSYNGAGQPTEYLHKEWDAGLNGWRSSFAYLFSYDAEGRLVGEILQTDWNYPSGILSDQDKSTYEYESGSDPAAITRYRKYTPSGEWAPRERSLFTYLAPGTVREEIVQRWSGSDWRNQYRNLFFYDGNGYLIEKAHQEWGGGSGWMNINRSLYENKATGEKLKATFQKWDSETMEWQNDYQYTYAYDEMNRRTDTYNQEWGAVGYEWSLKRAQRIAYDDNGNPTEELDQLAPPYPDTFRTLKTYNAENLLLTEALQKREAGAWLNVARHQYEYDETGSVVNHRRWYWKTSIQEWVLFSETLTQYQNGLLASETYVEFKENGDTCDYRRSVYTYDGRDSLREILVQFGSLAGDVWWNDQRTVFSYNPAGFRSEQLEQSWDWQADGWANVSRVAYAYNGEGRRVEQAEQSWQSETQGWANTRMDTWAYQDDGLVAEHYEFSWAIHLQRWQEAQRERFTYDGAGRETVYLSQDWSDFHGRLVNDARNYSYYDEGTGLLIFKMAERYDRWAEKWELQWRITYDYNEQGLLTDAETYQASPTQAGWVDASHCQTYWRTVVPTAAPPATAIRCICANPYTPGSPIAFEGLDAGGRYELRLTGMGGQTLCRQAFRGGDGLSIRSSLPPGLYTLSLHRQEQERAVYRQKLIIVPVE